MKPADTPLDPRRHRLHEAFRLCTADRASTADYQPMDMPFLVAWEATRLTAAADRPSAVDHLDRFITDHLDDLRDLALRARDGRAPVPVLDQIAAAIAAVA